MKSAAAYDAAVANDPRNGGYVSKLIAVLMQLKKYDEAMAKADYWVTITRDGKPEKQQYKVYADCWYYKGDYAKACEAELAAVRAGDRNFPGIGLPPDLARRP